MGDGDRQRLEALHARGVLTAEELHAALARLAVPQRPGATSASSPSPPSATAPQPVTGPAPAAPTRPAGTTTPPPGSATPPPQPDRRQESGALLPGRVLAEIATRRTVTADQLTRELGPDTPEAVAALQELGLLTVQRNGTFGLVAGRADPAVRALVLAVLTGGPAAPEQLVRRTGRPVVMLRCALRELLIDQRVRLDGNGNLVGTEIPLTAPPAAHTTPLQRLDELHRKGWLDTADLTAARAVTAAGQPVAEQLWELATLHQTKALRRNEFDAGKATLLAFPTAPDSVQPSRPPAPAVTTPTPQGPASGSPSPVRTRRRGLAAWVYAVLAVAGWFAFLTQDDLRNGSGFLGVSLLTAYAVYLWRGGRWVFFPVGCQVVLAAFAAAAVTVIRVALTLLT